MVAKKRVVKQAKAPVKIESQARPDTPIFEILVILAIVAIVAVTGQVLIHYDQIAKQGGPDSGGLTGMVVGTADEPETADFLDIGVTKVETNPESPLNGQPFEVKVTVENKGLVDVTVPFYIELKFIPQNLASAKEQTINTIMPQILKVGESAEASVFVTTVMPEGPLRIIATADSTVKLEDKNPSNNQMSKTVIVTNE
jgi:hypothetical protein